MDLDEYDVEYTNMLKRRAFISAALVVILIITISFLIQTESLGYRERLFLLIGNGINLFYQVFRCGEFMVEYHKHYIKCLIEKMQGDQSLQ